MPLFRISTVRERRTPVRVQQWDGSIRAGDDLKLALTVIDDDSGTAAQVSNSRSRLTLWPERPGGWETTPDYGMGWLTGAAFGHGSPAVSIDGYATAVRSGGINMAIPGTTTAGLSRGRYRIGVEIDLPDGDWCQIEGILQVRDAWGGGRLGHNSTTFFILDVSRLDVGILAPGEAAAGGFRLGVSKLSIGSLGLAAEEANPGSQAVDRDGFYLTPDFLPAA